MTETKFNQSSREALKRGIDMVADAVKVTLGARGRTVIIQRENGLPHVTKDGVTVAKSVYPEDPFEAMGADLIRDVARRTASEAGDGTTTATVLTQSIIADGMKYIVSGANPMDLKRGIDKGVQFVVEQLKAISRQIEPNSKSIEEIATISANNDSTVGRLLSQAMDAVGKNGVISIEQSDKLETEVDIIEGMHFGNGYVSPYFATDADSMTANYVNPMFLLSMSKIIDATELINPIEISIAENRPLIIIAEDVNGLALQMLIQNKIKNGLRVCGIKTPHFGEMRKDVLRDIAAMTGATIHEQNVSPDLTDFKKEDLGSAAKIKITGSQTIISSDSKYDALVKERVSFIEKRIEEVSGYDKEKLQERLAKLIGGIAVVKVGARTEVEMKEKKDRMDDALLAVRAAVTEGIIAGGGSAFVHVAKSMKDLQGENEDETLGIKIIQKSISAPCKQMILNSGKDFGAIIRDIETSDLGYNVKTEQMCDMIENGIIDPTKVARVALENAASIAGMILTTECSIVQKQK